MIRTMNKHHRFSIVALVACLISTVGALAAAGGTFFFPPAMYRVVYQGGPGGMSALPTFGSASADNELR